MKEKDLVSSIDAEIIRLQSARAILAGTTTSRSKPKAKTARSRKKKRKLTPEGRARISEAVKRRWAKVKRAAK